ncbi:MAG TPA: hypothetical protein VFW65_23155 [Pseudonocardiaceae bacterium]|nr:hypothetical protein [Pseudonocardiaceae bacterium]
MAGTAAPHTGILRILGAAAQRPVGVGFLVATTDGPAILTCAHVVCAALGLPRDHAEAPTDPVTVGPALPDGPTLTATIGFWQSYETGDMAALWPTGELPPAPRRRRAVDEFWDRRCAATASPRATTTASGRRPGCWTGRAAG